MCTCARRTENCQVKTTAIALSETWAAPRPRILSDYVTNIAFRLRTVTFRQTYDQNRIILSASFYIHGYTFWYNAVVKRVLPNWITQTPR